MTTYNKAVINEGVNQILAIVKERNEILEKLKKALIDDDDQKIKYYAAKYCGIDTEK